TSHSIRFCAPDGTWFIERVARRTNTINPIATTQVTTIELVMGKPNGRAISTAFSESSWTGSAADAPWPSVSWTTARRDESPTEPAQRLVVATASEAHTT